MRILFATLLILGLSAPTLADAQDAPKMEKVKKAKPKKICKNVAVETGSRMGIPKICKTQAEWDAEEARDADTVDSRTGGH